MNQIPLIFLGVFAAVASSFWGLVIVPQGQIGHMQSTRVEEIGGAYPRVRNGLAQKGAEVYRANGCVECHTQQLRPKTEATDIQRGWGSRRTIAQDYLLDSPVQLGAIRLGPDLTNVGRRQVDQTALLRKLYNPKLATPDSIMPRHEYLFVKRKLSAGETASAAALPADTEPGFEVVAKPEAIALAGYLQSLIADAPLYSAPIPKAKTNAPIVKTAAAKSSSK